MDSSLPDAVAILQRVVPAIGALFYASESTRLVSCIGGRTDSLHDQSIKDSFSQYVTGAIYY